MFYTIASIILICFEIGIVVSWVLDYVLFKRRRILSKKSLIYTVPVFIIIYLLYFLAHSYNEADLDFFRLFSIIGETVLMLGIRFNLSLIMPLVDANAFYSVALAGGCILTFITILFNLFVLFGSKTLNEYRKNKTFKTGGDVIIGVSPMGLSYLKKNKGSVLWADKIDNEVYNNLLKQEYIVHSAPLSAKNILKRLKGKEYHFIVFRDSQISYPEIIACFEKLKENNKNKIFLHLEASVNEMEIIRENYLAKFSEKTNSFVLPFCHYELMARKFLTDYPITKFIPRHFYNENLTLKDDKEINVVFLGMGKVNYELFKLLSTNFQFAKQKDGNLYSSSVHYYVVDQDEKLFNNEYFIKILNDYDKLFEKSDLPPAEPICDLKECMVADAHSIEIRKKLNDLINENSYTYVIISMEDDLKDTTLAYKLKNYLDEKTNYKIFVRSMSSEIKSTNKEESEVLHFGFEDDCFTHECIVNDDLMKLSQNVNDLYNDKTKSKWVQLKNWEQLPVVEQYSNIDSALNIYFKLGLLGLEIKKNKEGGLTKKQFIDNAPDAIMGNKNKNYEYYFELNKANVIAFIEHSRWNAYYLLNGYKPLPFKEFFWAINKKKVYELKHKNIDKKRHACLTTYGGIDKLIRYKYEVISKEKELGEKSVGDVNFNELSSLYSYDYIVVDGMYDALTALGYSILKTN